MSKKNLVGGLVLAGAAAAAAAAVVAAKKLSDSKASAEEPILLDLDGDGITDVVLEDLDGDGKIDTVTTEPPQDSDETAEPDLEIEFIVTEEAPEEPKES